MMRHNLSFYRPVPLGYGGARLCNRICLRSVTKLCKEFWDWRMKEFPEFATFCGFHKYDDRLNDHSVAAFQQKQVDAEGFLTRCHVLETGNSLGEEDALNVTLLRSDLETFLDGIEQEGYLFPVSYMEGMHVDFELLTSWMVFKTVHDFKLYLARLRALPPRLERDLELLKRGVAVQKTMSAYSLKGVVKAINTLVNTPAAESMFYKPFVDASHDIAPDALKPIQEEAVVVIREQIAPAFMKLATFIDEVYMKACRPEAGISSMPGGQSFYLRCLQWHMSLTLSPQQVHDIGLEEVNSIRGEMQKVIEKVGFGGTFMEFIAVLKGNKKFYYDSKDALMEGFRHICYKEIRPILSKIFHKIPKSELMIAEIPASRAHGPTAFYVSGTLDGTRPGKFFVNTYNLHRKATYDMMTLSLHEGEPGHHFQGMYAIEMKDLPMFRRHQEYRNYWQVPSRFPQHMAYSEGWGLYSEYLGKELGLYEDPYSLFGHLSAKMFRACRLVADTGLHALGWTHGQAVALFLENTAMSEAAVKDEVTRYITWPGQACAYMMGLLEIQRLRQKAAEKLGDTFDVRDFHAEVLQCGRVPLQVLETVIDKYISRQQSCDH